MADGYWDLHGKLNVAYEEDTSLTFEQVEAILDRRHKKAIDKK